MVQFVRVSYAELSPTEAARMHPDRWGGHFPGSTSEDGKPRTKFVPYRPGMFKPASISRRARAAVLLSQAAAHRPEKFDVTRFVPGMRFSPANFPSDAAIILDYATYLTRGTPYRLEPGEFPPLAAEPAQTPAPALGSPIYEREPHMHYRRETIVAVPVGRGDGRPYVAVTTMQSQVGSGEYAWQMGSRLLPGIVAVGAVTHAMIMVGGNEVVTRINAAQVIEPR